MLPPGTRHPAPGTRHPIAHPAPDRAPGTRLRTRHLVIAGTRILRTGALGPLLSHNHYSRMSRHFTRVLTLIAFFGLIVAPTVLAQDVAPAPADFEDAELTTFAEAYLNIELLQVQYQAEHGDIEDPEQMQAVQQQFEEEALGVIEKSGLSVERYGEIIVAAQTNEEFAEGLIERIETVRAQRAG
jgi:hypothetical protein